MGHPLISTLLIENLGSATVCYTFKFSYQFFKSIIRIFVEHNRAGVLALEHSIIGKKKSIICMSLKMTPCLYTEL